MNIDQRTASADYMLITPALAAEWLGKNRNFRTLRAKKVLPLVEDIKNDNWHINGESIKLTLDGQLTDGQHRLTAVVKADKPIISLVTWTDDQMAVDRGMARSFSQLLAAKGYTRAALSQATTRILYCVHHFQDVPLGLPTLTDDVSLTYFESLDYPILDICMGAALEASRVRVVPSAASYAAAMYLFYQVDPEAAQVFHTQLITGENLTANSPVLILRNRLLWMYITRDRGSAVRARIVTALLIKGWNAYITGRPIKLLKFLDTESFPPVMAGYEIEERLAA